MGTFKSIADGFLVTLALLTAACGGADLESNFEDALREALQDAASDLIRPGVQY